MKVYPDKKTELCCNGVFYGGIATIAVAAILIILSILFGHGTAHVVLRVLAYAAFAGGGGLFAYAARIGMRPRFESFFYFASIAVFVGGVMLAIDFAWVFGSIDPSAKKQTVEQTVSVGEASAQTTPVKTTTEESHIGEMILAMTCFPIIALSAFFLFALVGVDARKQFYELTRDRMLCIGSSCATAVAGLLAILLSVVKHDGVQTAALWEELGLLIILLLAFGAPTALLVGCSRLSDPVTDKEIEEGFKMAEPPKKPVVEKEKKAVAKPGKPDNAAKQGKPGKPERDVKKGVDGKREPERKEPEKKRPERPEADKKENEKPEESRKLGFMPKGKKDKDKDKDRKKHEDRKPDNEIKTDVISTTRRKPVESTNPTDLDAFLRKAEEEEERKERDAVWEAAREKKVAEKREIAEATEAAVKAADETKPDETVFSDKNSKKKDKKKEKERRKKEKDKELRGVNTALFTNPNERRNEKRYIPASSIGLDDGGEEKPEEIESKLTEAVEPAENSAAAVSETAVPVVEATGDLAGTAAVAENVVGDAVEAAESAISQGEGSFFGETESTIFEELERESAAVDAAEAAARAAAEVAEQSGSAFEMTEESAEWDNRAAEELSEEEQLKADQEDAFRKLQGEIDRRLQERSTEDAAAETAEEIADEAAEAADDIAEAAETEIAGGIEAAAEFVSKAEETVEEAAEAAAAVASEAGEAVAESADKAVGNEAEESGKEESAEPKEESLADMLRRLGLIGKEEPEPAKSEEKAEEATDAVGEAAGEAARNMEEITDSAKEAAGEIAAEAEEIIDNAAEVVGEATADAEKSADAAAETFGEVAEGIGEAIDGAEKAAANVEETFAGAVETAEQAESASDETAENAEPEDAGLAFSERIVKTAKTFGAVEEEKEDDTEDLFSPVSAPAAKPVEETPAEPEEEETFAFTPTDYVKSSFDKAMKAVEAERLAAEDNVEDLFAPAGTRAEKAAPAEEAPAAAIKPEPAEAKKEPEQEENELPDYERAPEISNANQAILWALKHGNSFADAAKASAAEAEAKAKAEEEKAAGKLTEELPKTEFAAAEAVGTFETAAESAAEAVKSAVEEFAGEEEEEPASFAEAMAEALASSGEETAAEAVDEPEPIVISDANSAILAAMEAARTRRMTETVAPVDEAAAETVKTPDTFADAVPDLGWNIAETVRETAEPAESAAETIADTVTEIEETAEETSAAAAAEAGEEIADSFAEAMESAEAAEEYISEELEAAEESFEEAADNAEEADDDFADALEAARERWANLEDDDGESDEEESLTEDEYDSTEADEPESEEPEFEEEAPEAAEAEFEVAETEADESEYEEAETEEPEPVNDGPIVPVYLQKQTMAMSPEERARRAAAKASAVRNAPKQQKPAPATSVDASMDEFTRKLKALKMAYENELITEEEFTEAKKHLLELL